MIQRFQEMVLAAIEWLGPGCRIADIRAVVEDRLEQGRAFGAVFTTLDRLEAAGLVTWRLGPSQPRRGGRAPRLYALTVAGRDALAQARAVAGG